MKLRRLTRLGSVAALVPLMLLFGQVVPAQAATGATDLSILTTDSADPVNAGQSFTYTLLVSNIGANDATSLVVADAIPAAFTLTNATAPTGLCTSVAPNVSCTLPSLVAADTWTITVSVTAKTSVPGGTITNTATVASPEDVDVATAANNTSSQDTVLNKSADLSIVKTVSADQVNAGDSFTYTLVVTNNGPDTANTLVVTDAVPAALTLTGASASSGVCTAVAPNVNCSLASLAAAATWTITVNVTAKVSVPGGKITNSATVAATEFDPVLANNTSSKDTTLNKSADLSIVATDSADPVNAGDAFTYSLVVTNNGPDAATLVVVKDAIPSGLTLTGASSSDATGACTSVAPDVNCALPTLAGLATWTITVNVTADSANPGGPVTNTATVAATEFDPLLPNNVATLITTVTPAADLVLTNVPSSTKPVEGQNLSFVLTVTNDGPGAATNVVVTAKLPQNLKFVSAKTSDGKYDSGSGKWSIGSIAAVSSGLTTKGSVAAAASSSVSLTIKAQPRSGTSGQKIVLKAKITASDQVDPTSNNNTSSAVVNVQSASGGGSGGGGGGTGGTGGTAFTGSNVSGAMAVDLSLLLLGLGALIASAVRRRSARGLVREVLGPEDLGSTWAC